MSSGQRGKGRHQRKSAQQGAPRGKDSRPRITPSPVAAGPAPKPLVAEPAPSQQTESRKKWRTTLIAGIASTVTFVAGGLTGGLIDRYSPSAFDWLDSIAGRDLLAVEVADWPGPLCSTLQVAPLDSRPDATGQSGAPQMADPHEYVAAGQGAPYRVGSLTLTITSPTGAPMLINSIEPVIYDSTNDRPHWALADHTSECGGSGLRVLDGYLNESGAVLIDSGVNDAGGWDEAANDLGDTFTVSEDEPMVVRLWMNACQERNYSFGFRIKYTLHGAEYEWIEGDEHDPYHIVGVPTQQLWMIPPGPEQVAPAGVTDFESPSC